MAFIFSPTQFPTATTIGGVKSKAAISSNFLTSIGTDGSIGQAQPAASDLSNGVTGSGAVVLATAPTLSSPVFVVGGDTGALGIGATALAAANAWTGNQTHSGTEAFAKINSIVLVDGNTYPRSVAGIALAVAALGTSPGWVILSPGQYTDDGTTTVTIAYARQHLLGGGKWATKISADAARAVPVFKFSAGAAVLYQNSIGGLTFIGAGTSKKTAIQAIDTSELYIHDISILAWTGATSVGIDLQGRELLTMARMSISADNPIQINPNPNSTISLDASHFEDLYLLPFSAQYGITVAANVSVTHWTWDGTNVVAGGGGAIYWNETSASVQSEQINLSNIHHEQGTTPANYSFYFARGVAANGLRYLTMINCVADPTQNGFFFQKTNGTTLIAPNHAQAGGTALNADNTNYNLVIVNPFWQTGATTTNNALNASYGGSITAPTLNLSNSLALLYGGTGADLSTTGGTSQVLKQITTGAAITVAQLAASDLSNGTTGSGAVVLAVSPAITNHLTISAAATTADLGILNIEHADTTNNQGINFLQTASGFSGPMAVIRAKATDLGGSSKSSLEFATNSGADTVPTVKMTIDSAGNVGIGTAPVQTLTVGGTLGVSGVSTCSQQEVTGAASAASGSNVRFGSTTSATANTTGGGLTLPLLAAGYLVIYIGSTPFKIPYYAS